MKNARQQLNKAAYRRFRRKKNIRIKKAAARLITLAAAELLLAYAMRGMQGLF